MNRYLMDRASRRRMMRDGRNPYGSRGGYVSSRRGRGRDREMGGRNDYTEYDSRYNSGYDTRYGNQDYHYGYEQPREHNRPMEYEMYGIGGFRPMHDMNYDMGDYDMARGRGRSRGGRSGRRDYDYDYNYDYDYEDYDYDMRDYEEEDKEWKKHLKKWCEDLKQHDRFNMPKDQILHSAKQMGIKFEDYNEEEFLTTYYMILSDYSNQLIPNPQEAILFAKDWLEDKDSDLKGSEKLCAYYYEVVKAKSGKK